MASAILSSILRVTDRLSAPILRSLTGSSSSSSPSDFRDHLNKLNMTLDSINAVLYDAESREVGEESVKLWLRELKGVAYDADDLFDELRYEFLKSKLENEGRSRGSHKRKWHQIDEFEVSPLDDAKYRGVLLSRIKAILAQFDVIARERAALQLRELSGDRRMRVEGLERTQTSSLISVPEIYGRDGDSRRVIEMLLSESCDDGDVYVVPIVGMAGVGKSTLCQVVYNDPIVCQHFKARGWVCVSERFDVYRLMKQIIESIRKLPCNVSEPTFLEHELRDALQGKKFLLVLDDVWNEDKVLWEKLHSSLTSDVEGSRIVVTTRNESVAQIVQTVPFYKLDCLSNDDCWLLFKSLAFDGRDASVYPDLVKIGKAIADKCMGLPLAAKALGGLLCHETDKEMWIDVFESDLWNLEETENNILPALQLSYKHLPVHLKRCFTYCSVFPKGYVFRKDSLVRLWMAQGFLHRKDNQEPEEVGSEYFDDLVLRSFFQYSLLEIGEDENFLLHDLFHDLAQFISGNECLLSQDSNFSDIPTDARHLSLVLYGSNIYTQLKSAEKPKHLRSLQVMNWLMYSHAEQGMWEKNVMQVKIPKDMFSHMEFLRTLNLAYTDIENLPDSIANLRHLRYLGLRNTRIKFLPEFVCKLYYLQSLDLRYCNNLLELPSGIGSLVNLRYLDMPTMEYANICMPAGMARLTCIQNLAAFNVGADDRHCGVEDLRNMTNLRGDLYISGLKNVRRRWNAKEANLKNKPNIERLVLDWFSGQLNPKCSHITLDTAEKSVNFNLIDTEAVIKPLEHFDEESLILDSLQPHPNLKVLNVRYYSGTTFPKWLGDPSFSNLVVLSFFCCENCQTLPPFGDLPSLKKLYLKQMTSVKCIAQEFSGTKKFPSLQTLHFEYLPEWVEWYEVDKGAFCALSNLFIRDCQKLMAIPENLGPSLKCLEIGDCKMLSALPSSPSLTSLCIGGVFEEDIWSCIFDQPMLEVLEIVYCEGLKCLSLHNMMALKKLVVEDCSQLASFDCKTASTSATSASSSLNTSRVGLHNLIRLEHLKLEKCPMLQFGGAEKLPWTLKEVEISCCPKLLPWCAEPAISSQLELIPTVLVEDYDPEEFEDFVANMVDDEMEENIDEE